MSVRESSLAAFAALVLGPGPWASGPAAASGEDWMSAPLSVASFTLIAPCCHNVRATSRWRVVFLTGDCPHSHSCCIAQVAPTMRLLSPGLYKDLQPPIPPMRPAAAILLIHRDDVVTLKEHHEPDTSVRRAGHCCPGRDTEEGSPCQLPRQRRRVLRLLYFRLGGRADLPACV